jgi:HK97 family phage portal protein
MKIFGWKSAGRALARPDKTHVPLTRPFGARSFGGGSLGEWPQYYEAQLREGYLNNAIAQRAVRLVAEGVASAPLLASDDAARALVTATSGGQALLETLAAQLLLHGNGYVQLLTAPDGSLCELYALRPERVSIEADVRGWPAAFRYKAGEAVTRLGSNEIIHIRTHHPLDDHYGLGCLGAASGAIAIHNASAKWNKALLDNAARPSGALVHEAAEALSGDQFDRLKEELATQFSGQANAGRPMLLEGGLKWQTLSLSPADMDFAGLKAAAAREIALAFGVPSMLLGLPGDATYANYREANKALWRQAILPLAAKILDALAEGLQPWFADLTLKIDANQVTALSEDRERLWVQVSAADFLTLAEKRAAVGLAAVPETAMNAAKNKSGILELKFNPWHDHENGQFTFARDDSRSASGGGGFGGGGASGSWDPPTKPKPQPKNKPKPLVIPERPAPVIKPRKVVIKPPPKPIASPPSVSREAPVRDKPSPDIKPTGNPSGSMIAAGAAVAIGAAAAAKAIAAATANAAKPIAVPPTVSAGGYNFDKDSLDRTGKIYGKLRLEPKQIRSRRLQREAGKPDREPSDHGGHFIAREFGGPKIAENHFAQAARINRGKYRRLENKWKRALKRGKEVEVEITPRYSSSSKRPDSLDIVYKINGKIRTKKIPNKARG